MEQDLAIVKIGGNVIEDENELSNFLFSFSQLPSPKILVHGGGKLATQIAEKLGIRSQMVEGRRITDSESLKVITMVYGGLANKNIVARLQSLHCNAIGLSGADGDSVRAHKRPVQEVDFGYVGDVDSVNIATIAHLLQGSLTPVFCAMTHDGNGQLLNTNADTIASEIAIAMSGRYRTTLYYCFEKKGVLLDINDPTSVVKDLNSRVYATILEKKLVSDGMLPKLQNCFYALNKNVNKVCIGDISMLRPHPDLYTTITL
ncbi:MAG: acetylglutamate kinase [Sediminicola sp.]